MAVNQQKNSRIKVARLGETTEPKEGIVPVVGHVQARCAAQNISKGMVAEFFNFVRGNDVDRSWRARHLLFVFGCAEDRLHLDIGQLLKRQVLQSIGGIRN